MTIFNRVVPPEGHPSPPAPNVDERGSEEQFKSLLLNIPGAVYRRDCVEPWAVRFISDHIEALTGYPAIDFLQDAARPFASIICPDDREHVEQRVPGGAAPRRPVLSRVPPDACERLVPLGRRTRSHGVADSGGRAAWIDGVIIDLSAQGETEQLGDRGETLRHRQTGHDLLTGLPGRTLIRDRLQQMLLRCQRDDFLIAAFLVDLDNFRSVNDNLGHRPATSC